MVVALRTRTAPVGSAVAEARAAARWLLDAGCNCTKSTARPSTRPRRQHRPHHRCPAGGVRQRPDGRMPRLPGDRAHHIPLPPVRRGPAAVGLRHACSPADAHDPQRPAAAPPGADPLPGRCPDGRRGALRRRRGARRTRPAAVAGRADGRRRRDQRRRPRRAGGRHPRAGPADRQQRPRPGAPVARPGGQRRHGGLGGAGPRRILGGPRRQLRGRDAGAARART